MKLKKTLRFSQLQASISRKKIKDILGPFFKYIFPNFRQKKPFEQIFFAEFFILNIKEIKNEKFNEFSLILDIFGCF